MLLAIDSCGAVGGIALGELTPAQTSREGEASSISGPSSAQPRVWFREMAGKSYSESLLPAVEAILHEADAALDQIQSVVVVHGPGSFTGIRIGVSAAKGLAEGLAIPLVALSRLELLARRSPERSAIAVVDAGRGEFFAGFYRNGVCETEALLTLDALSQAVESSGLPIVVCEQELFPALSELSPALMATPTAIEALMVGAERFLAEAFDDVGAVEANYLRRSESEMLTRIAVHAARKDRNLQPVAIAE